MANKVKIIIYENDGCGETTSNSLAGITADIVRLENKPENISEEILDGDHKFIILTDNRNTFDPECVINLIRTVSDDGISCPVFKTSGCREEFHPSILDIHGKEQPFRLSWNHSPDKGEEPRSVRCAMGCCQAFTKEWFSKIGGFIGVSEPDNRDIFLSLISEAMGGSCVVVPRAKITRRFGAPVRSRLMGKEMLKMAFSCLSQEDLQKFLNKYTSQPIIEGMVLPEEIGKWMRFNMERRIK